MPFPGSVSLAASCLFQQITKSKACQRVKAGSLAGFGGIDREILQPFLKCLGQGEKRSIIKTDKTPLAILQCRKQLLQIQNKLVINLYGTRGLEPVILFFYL